MTHGGGWLTVAGVPVSQANEFLGASYKLYNHALTNETILRAVGYALPPVLHFHVQTVAPTTAFTSMRLLQQMPRSRSDGEVANVVSGEPSDVLSRRDTPYVGPAHLRWEYDTFTYEPAAPFRNTLGIAGFGNERPSQMDQLSFLRRFRADARGAIVIVVPVNGGETYQSPPGPRGSLDTQYSVALTYPTQVVYYTIGGTRNISPNGEPGPGDQYLEWLLYMTNLPRVPQTISVPYFTDELDIPEEYATSLCLLFGQLGTLGSSVLVASGDDGVGRGNCRDSSGKVQFRTTFPASCMCDV
jgi:tripeptidyl-peptidase-1